MSTFWTLNQALVSIRYKAVDHIPWSNDLRWRLYSSGWSCIEVLKLVELTVPYSSF